MKKRRLTRQTGNDIVRSARRLAESLREMGQPELARQVEASGAVVDANVEAALGGHDRQAFAAEMADALAAAEASPCWDLVLGGPPVTAPTEEEIEKSLEIVRILARVGSSSDG